MQLVEKLHNSDYNAGTGTIQNAKLSYTTPKQHFFFIESIANYN